MTENNKKNLKCFIGMPSCGYIYESAKSCFIACPSDKKYTIKIQVIRDILESKQYECHIALQRSDPGSFAFCTKICSRIIQSQFCIVFLDYSENGDGIEFPNPNVHMEYGMMLGQNKHIIPLQDEKYKLNFNIAPLDTIKYSDENFKSKVIEAIDNAIIKSSKTDTIGQLDQGKDLQTYYNISGFTIADIKLNFFEILYQFGQNLGFFLLVDKRKLKYKYFATFDFEDPKLIVLHTKILIDNIVNAYESTIAALKPDQNKEEYKYLIRDISIDVVIPKFYYKEDILDHLTKMIKSIYEIKITLFYRTDFTELIKEEYKNIDDFKPKKT
jgi:hypothetical protein